MACFSGPEIVNDGLVLHLDAANSRSYPGSGTTWSDLSGNGNNGTLVNGVGYSGDNNGYLSFDGVNDYVSLASIDLSGSQLSVCCFIRPLTLGSGSNVNVILRKGEANPNIYQFGLADGRIFFFISGNDGTGIIGSTVLSVNNWYFVAMSYNAGATRVFLNDRLDGTASIAASIGNNATNLYVGSRNGADYTANHVSNISVYNKTLSDVEIQQNFEATRSRYGI